MTEEAKTSTELIAKIEHPKKRAFLENYHKTRLLTKTAEAIDVDRTTVHYWITRDDAFSTAFHALKKELDLQLIEHYENVIKEVVDSDKTPPQSRLLGSFFTLKALVPEKYREQVRPMVSIGEIKVISSVPRPKYIEGEYREIEPEDDGNAT